MMQKKQKKGTFRPVPGLSREDEEKQLKEIIDIAQANLIRTESYVKALSDEYHDLVETYGPKDKEALAMLLPPAAGLLSAGSKAL